MHKLLKWSSVLLFVISLTACSSFSTVQEPPTATIELLIKENPECESVFVAFRDNRTKVIRTPNHFKIAVTVQIKDKTTTLMHVYASRLVMPNDHNTMPYIAKEEADLILSPDKSQEIKLSDGKTLVVTLIKTN